MRTRLIRWVSVLLATGASLFFVSYAYHALAGKDLSALLNGRVLAATAALTVMYMLLIPTTSVAWTWLLHAMEQPVKHIRMLVILASTQFGKYLPGNVAQHIGRVGLARAAGVPLSVALFSVAYEALLVLVACAHVSALTLLWTPPAALSHWQITAYRLPILIAVTLCATMALILVPRMASRLAKARSAKRGEANPTSLKLHLNVATVISSYAMYVINFCLIGCGLWLVAHALTAGMTPAPNMVFLIGAFACSWILGFIAPGAPAGLGIREAILSAWLSGAMPAADVVLLVVALRIATTLGDLINFAWGSIVMLKLRPSDGAL